MLGEKTTQRVDQDFGLLERRELATARLLVPMSDEMPALHGAA